MEKVIAVAAVFIGIIILFTLPTMLLWNWLMPVIFHLPTITFWQAMGVDALCGILFKSYSTK